MLFGRKTSAESCLYDLVRDLKYSQRFLRDKSEEELRVLQENYESSLFRRFCKCKKIPFLGSFYSIDFRKSEFSQS